jgi:hypothetical protein
MEVLEPLWLREEMASKIERMCNQYCASREQNKARLVSAEAQPALSKYKTIGLAISLQNIKTAHLT